VTVTVVGDVAARAPAESPAPATQTAATHTAANTPARRPRDRECPPQASAFRETVTAKQAIAAAALRGRGR
jgi:hypothetical protein